VRRAISRSIRRRRGGPLLQEEEEEEEEEESMAFSRETSLSVCVWLCVVVRMERER
jgi:hypothetical protein